MKEHTRFKNESEGKLQKAKSRTKQNTKLPFCLTTTDNIIKIRIAGHLPVIRTETRRTESSVSIFFQILKWARSYCFLSIVHTFVASPVCFPRGLTWRSRLPLFSRQGWTCRDWWDALGLWYSWKWVSIFTYLLFWFVGLNFWQDWFGRTSGSCGLPEAVGTVQQVHYFEGDLSFMCVLSIKVPIRKKSGNLFNDARK